LDGKTTHLLPLLGVRDPQLGAARLQTLGEQLSHWPGRIYEKLASNLTQWAKALFAYQPLLQ